MLEIMKAYTLGYQTAKKGKEMKTCRNIKLNNIMKWSNLDERREIESEYRQGYKDYNKEAILKIGGNVERIYNQLINSGLKRESGGMGPWFEGIIGKLSFAVGHNLRTGLWDLFANPVNKVGEKYTFVNYPVDFIIAKFNEIIGGQNG